MNGKRIIVVSAVFCLMVAVCASLAFAQQTATVSGHVFNEDNEQPVPGANIVIESLDSSQNYYANTDGSGYYSVNLPAGEYHVTVNANNYQQWETNFYMGLSPQNYDIPLNPTGGYYDNYDDDPSDGSGDFEGFEMPFGDMDEEFITTMLTILVSLIVIFFICLVTITVALIIISSRLGKIRKELIALNESQKPKVQGSPVYQQQQPPPQ